MFFPLQKQNHVTSKRNEKLTFEVRLTLLHVFQAAYDSQLQLIANALTVISKEVVIVNSRYRSQKELWASIMLQINFQVL